MCRSILDNQSYILFTFDKLINATVKALSTLVQDDFTSKVLRLFNMFPKNRSNE
jgi:hypothetical protein